MERPPRLKRKPEIRAERVEELVEMVRRGLVRVPRFQRGLKWTSSDVLALFDSIYQGYPIGSLIFCKQPGAAERLRVGPLEIDAPEIAGAWWVVDGQQRLTSLAACLGRSMPLPTTPDAEDPFVLYFDASDQMFKPAPAAGPIPSIWVPLPLLLDTIRLADWLLRWQHREKEELSHTIAEASSRIREYPVSLCRIETEDTSAVKEIFLRINLTGRALTWTEVHTALFGGKGSAPSTLEELAVELMGVGMGRLDEDRLLRMSLALRGEDLYPEDPRDMRGAVQEALPVIRRALSFLRKDAGIPHLQFLPKSVLLDVLSRFFALHEDPKPRTRLLLVRWFWRAVLGSQSVVEPTLRRRGLSAITDDEEQTAQNLLSLVRKGPLPFELPLDGRANTSRIAFLALSRRGPCDLEQGQRIDVAALLEQEGKGTFGRILKKPGLRRSRGPANRIIQPRDVSAHRLLLDRISRFGTEDPVLASHAIDAPAAELLAADDLEGFLESRAKTITDDVLRLSEQMAAWEYNDRPSVEYLLATSGAEP